MKRKLRLILLASLVIIFSIKILVVESISNEDGYNVNINDERTWVRSKYYSEDSNESYTQEILNSKINLKIVDKNSSGILVKYTEIVESTEKFTKTEFLENQSNSPYNMYIHTPKSINYLSEKKNISYLDHSWNYSVSGGKLTTFLQVFGHYANETRIYDMDSGWLDYLHFVEFYENGTISYLQELKIESITLITPFPESVLLALAVIIIFKRKRYNFD